MLFRPTPSRSLLAVSAALGLAACDSGGSARPRLTPAPSGLRIAGPSTAGAAGDALAASLWISSGSAVRRPGRPAFAMANGALAGEMRFRAEADLEAEAFAAGGKRLEGSAMIRRLAAEPTAPADRNGNGSNLDETLADFTGRIAALAGGTAPPVFPLLFSFEDRVADFAAPIGSATRRDYGRLATAPGAMQDVDMEQVGNAMLARVLVAASKLQTSRGSRPGPDPQTGIDGLLLMMQAVAAEETLLRSLFNDGTLLGRLRDPANYDPTFGKPYWLPHSFTAADDPAIPGAPAAYTPYDQASTLSGLSAVLLASSELAWLASDLDPNPTLRDLLHGYPFGMAPGVSGGTVPAPAAAAAAPNWEDDIRPLLTPYGCFSCHLSGPGAQGGLSLSTYAEMLQGGDHQAQLPIVVKGDHESSLLWQILQMDVGTIPRMPQGGPSYATAAEVQTVGDWIDAGAPEFPERVGFAVGSDLAVALARNIAGMHLDPATGALNDRHEGDAPNGFAMARSTGDALFALASFVAAVPSELSAPQTLGAAAGYALDVLTRPDGSVVEGSEIQTGAAFGVADLHAQARMTAGLLAAGRTLARNDLLDRGRACARVLLDDYFDDTRQLFLTRPGEVSVRYTPIILAAVLDALREIAADGVVTGAAQRHDAFLTTLRPVLVFSEWDGLGEVLGDGIADTDGNGIPEPALAGGPNGRAPLFSGEILDGPAPSPSGAEPITWSKHIQPLLRNACVGCHLDGARQGDYRVDTPSLLRQAGESGGAFPLVVPGDPEASLLYRKLVDRRPPVGTQMPFGPPLNAHGKELVRLWILQGATSR